MKKIFLLLMVCGLGYITQAQPSDQPKDITKMVEFTNAEYDFGKIPFGKPVEYTVSIKNISSDSVWIDDVKVGCGCTTPKFEKAKKYAPGETIIVTLGFSGTTMGQFSKFATIYFNNNAFNKQVTFKGETYTVPSAAPTNGALEKVKPANN
ncbi:MAG: hypothetical protein C0459_01450 [Chitinophaga sp.]|jgi:Protein of unknown function (DUF1573)|nr:hypothetical protein [Chitinophaga sp.]